MTRSKIIFGNPISPNVQAKALKNQKKYVRKFGDDRATHYPLTSVSNLLLNSEFDTSVVALGDKGTPVNPEKAVLVGNIRMGYGHYRIAMAIASAARHLGYKPYWFDMSSFEDTTGSKVINHLNGLYSLGSRLSQKSSLFNRFYWDPLNSKGFLKLDYNAVDQKVAELMTPVFGALPKSIPFIGTHTWTAQAAVHAGMERVVNIIPDNWPMGLHLAEGSVHTVQTPSSYFGYKTLKGMAEGDLNPMPEGSLVNVGHYIDHELVCDLESDTAMRVKRLESGNNMRLLMPIGGAGAQYQLYKSLLKNNMEKIENGELTVFLNLGDHNNVLEQLKKDFSHLGALLTIHQNDWEETRSFAQATLEGSASPGIHVFYNDDLFAAVYATNLLMRASDLLVTKPSELAFYPVPKLMIKRVGGHEAWGAIRAAEVGDGTCECTTDEEIERMLTLLIGNKELLLEMNRNILKAKNSGVYDGAYKAVQLAVED